MEQEHLEKIKTAREKYKPEKITCLFIAEATPSAPDRFFYFEEVWEQDSLYLELMKVLLANDDKENKKNNRLVPLVDIASPSTSQLRSKKKNYLEKFKSKGYYLIDNLDYPMPFGYSRTKEKIRFLEGQKEKLYNKVKTLVDKRTPIVLISIPVYQANAGTLEYYGYNVIHNEPIPFPGSGQQARFRGRMEEIGKIILQK